MNTYLRQTQNCHQPTGTYIPVIDRNRCEGKGACTQVCPKSVFAISTLSPTQRSVLNWRGKLKALAHGGKQAFAVLAESCEACGECVKACPEDAIRLQRVLHPTAIPPE